MTKVRFEITRETPTGRVQAHGRVECHPSVRRNVDGEVVVPEPFVVNVSEGEPPPEVEMEPTTTQWVWAIREQVAAGAEGRRYVAVPNTTEVVKYGALEEVNPGTLDPIDSVPSVAETIEQKVQEEADAREQAVAARLEKGQNLADVADAAQARTNLALGSAATRNAGEAEGVASLDGDARVPEGQLPPRLAEEELSATYVTYSGLPVNAADPRFGGIVADGDLDTRLGTDNADAFRAAIAHAKATGKRAVYIPGDGTYSTTKTIPLPSGIKVYSDGPGACRIVCPTPGIPVFASENWLTEFGGNPGGRASVEGILVRAEANDTNSHGFVMRDYHSAIRSCVAQQCGGDGFRADAATQGGGLIGNTLVENYYEELFADQNRGWGFRQNSTNGTQLTDAHMMNVVVRGRSQASNPDAAEAQGGISIPFAAGWQVSKVHTYGRFIQDGIVFGNCWGGSILDGAHIEQGYEGSGLRMPNFQRGGILDNIIIAMSEYGDRIMLNATKHSSLYPGEPLQIGTLTLVSNFATTGTGVSWNTQTTDLLISRLSLAGPNVGSITMFGGFGAANIKTILNARVTGALADSAAGGTLTYKGAALGLAPLQKWGGSGEQVLSFAVPPMVVYDRWEGIVSVSSRANYDGARRTTWVAHVLVTTKGSTTGWHVMTTDLSAASGFTSNPVVTVNGTTGVLTLTFTPSTTDGYGAASVHIARA